MKKIEIAESVTSGHPDKMCDQISDAILDAYLKVDPSAKVAVECSVHEKGVLIFGEITSKKEIDIEKIARQVICDIGYNDDAFGFNGKKCDIKIELKNQSIDIKKAVEKKELGAGDQGIMIGFACDETEEFMPYPIFKANQLTQFIDDLRKDGALSYLGPDGKVEVAVEYIDNKPKRIDTLIVSVQHKENINQNQLKQDLFEKAIKPLFSEVLDENSRIYINPSGRFVIGGPKADCGLTGRKLMVDTYGTICPHGGGAFSGKDATKVDRSASYFARYVAKNIVAAHLATKCKVTIGFVIGEPRPFTIQIDTFNTNKIPEEEIQNKILQVFDFSLQNMITFLSLQEACYKKTAVYGHFGRKEFTWEKLDHIPLLKEKNLK